MSRLDGTTIAVVGAERPWVAAAVALWRQRGATVFTLGPDPGGHDHVQVDLADMDAARVAAGRLGARTHQLDRLVIASGSWQGSGHADGLSLALARLHLGPFLLTREVRPLLEAAPSPRVVLVTSPVQVGGRLELDQWALRPRTTSVRIHADAALARTLWAAELARRWPLVAVHCLDPGTSGDVPAPTSGVLGWLAKQAAPYAGAPEQATAALDHVLTEHDLLPVTGGYFKGTVEARPLLAGRDEHTAARLWAVSEALVDGREPPPDLTWEPVLP